MSGWLPSGADRALRASALLTLALMVGSTSACGSSTTPRSDLGFSVAIIYGTVTTQAGAVVPGATIRGQVWPPSSCGSGIRTGGGQPDIVQTDDAGHYRQKLSATDVRQYCVTVNVQPPAGLAVDSATVSGTEVDFKDSRDVPYDSARVDVVLPSAP